MIFNLISKAKDLFINRDKTGVAADNVEDAISVLNSNLPNRPIKVSTKGFTIVDCIRNTPIQTITSYIYDESETPSDFPSALANATYFPIVTINRISENLARISIETVQNDTGQPDTIEGYYNGSRFYWGKKILSGYSNGDSVTFPDGYFTEAPTITITPYGYSTTYLFLFNVTTASNNGFTVGRNALNITNMTVVGASEGYNWIAIGK